MKNVWIIAKGIIKDDEATSLATTILTDNVEALEAFYDKVYNILETFISDSVKEYNLEIRDYTIKELQDIAASNGRYLSFGHDNTIDGIMFSIRDFEAEEEITTETCIFLYPSEIWKEHEIQLFSINDDVEEVDRLFKELKGMKKNA